MKILILCTGNSGRSQMAEGYMHQFDPVSEVISAGTSPRDRVNPYAVRVMAEEGIDISSHYPKDVTTYVNDSFDYVITVCDNARESCPFFVGEVRHRLHFTFEDPTELGKSEEEALKTFRRVRDQIKVEFEKFHRSLSS
jgi:arsenate reductase